MNQDVGFFDVGTSCPDLVIENGDLKADNGLETAALISVFSNKRITLEEVPRNGDTQEGWWGDLVAEVEGDQIGSKYWLLETLGKVSDSTPAEMQSVLEDAFRWMLDDGIAAQIIVTASRTGTNEVAGNVDIYRPTGRNTPFSFAWDGQKLKLFEEI